MTKVREKEKDKIWVIIANASDAQVYEAPSIYLEKLAAVHEFINTEGRTHNKELRDFNIGRVHNKNYPRTKGLSPKASPHELISMSFAKIIADYIEMGRINHSFNKLMIVAAPKFLGNIRKLLSKQTKTMLWNEIPKELNFEKKDELIEYFHSNP